MMPWFCMVLKPPAHDNAECRPAKLYVFCVGAPHFSIWVHCYYIITKTNKQQRFFFQTPGGCHKTLCVYTHTLVSTLGKRLVRTVLFIYFFSCRFLLQLTSPSSALNHGIANLNIVETNAFKHLTHLSLKLLPGSDVEIKKYLATCLAAMKVQEMRRSVNIFFHCVLNCCPTCRQIFIYNSCNKNVLLLKKKTKWTPSLLCQYEAKDVK